MAALQAGLEIEMEIERLKVLHSARGVDLDDLVKRGYNEFPIPTMKDVKKGRKKFGADEGKRKLQNDGNE